MYNLFLGVLHPLSFDLLSLSPYSKGTYSH